MIGNGRGPGLVRRFYPVLRSITQQAPGDVRWPAKKPKRGSGAKAATFQYVIGIELTCPARNCQSKFPVLHSSSSHASASKKYRPMTGGEDRKESLSIRVC